MPLQLLRFVVIVCLGITYLFLMYTANVSIFNLWVKLNLEISLNLNICTRLFTNRISYKVRIYNYTGSAQGPLRACVSVCAYTHTHTHTHTYIHIYNIPLSVSHVNRMKKEISNCMGTIRRLRHWFVM